MTLGKKLVLGAATAAFFLVLFGLLNPAKPRSEQIKDGCSREFADRGEVAVNQCVLKLMARELAEDEKARLDRAGG